MYIIKCKIDRFMEYDGPQFMTSGKYYLAVKESWNNNPDHYKFTDDQQETHYTYVDDNKKGGLFSDEICLISDLSGEEKEMITMLYPGLLNETK